MPLKPLTVPMVMVDDVVPPGPTASGLKGAACSVTFCADAATVSASKATNRNKAVMPVGMIRLDFENSNCDGLDFNMSGL